MTVRPQAELRRRIREAMAAKRCTPKQLAKALRHPHAQTVHRWLSDDAPPKGRAISIANLEKIAKVLGVTVDSLDPDGTEAYDPLNRPQYMRRGNGRLADTESASSHTSTIPVQSGLPLMAIGVPPMDFPDLALFDKLTGLWRALDPDERRAVYNTAARYIGSTADQARLKNK